jgi:hypothetical protein
MTSLVIKKKRREDDKIEHEMERRERIHQEHWISKLPSRIPFLNKGRRKWKAMLLYTPVITRKTSP